MLKLFSTDRALLFIGLTLFAVGGVVEYHTASAPVDAVWAEHQSQPSRDGAFQRVADALR